MRQAEQECKINGVQVREMSVEMRSPIVLMGKFIDQFSLKATYSTVSVSDTGAINTHGRCTEDSKGWSTRTWDALHELINSMEEDLLPLHFKIKEEVDERTESGGLGEGVGQI